MEAFKFFIGAVSIIAAFILFFVLVFWLAMNGMWYVALGVVVLALAGAVTADEFL